MGSSSGVTVPLVVDLLSDDDDNGEKCTNGTNSAIAFYLTTHHHHHQQQKQLRHQQPAVVPPAMTTVTTTTSSPVVTRTPAPQVPVKRAKQDDWTQGSVPLVTKTKFKFKSEAIIASPLKTCPSKAKAKTEAKEEEDDDKNNDEDDVRTASPTQVTLAQIPENWDRKKRRPFQCRFCNGRFLNAFLWKAHVDKHVDRQRRENEGSPSSSMDTGLNVSGHFECAVCPRRFLFSTSRATHCLIRHPNIFIPPLVLPMDSEFFPSRVVACTGREAEAGNSDSGSKNQNMNAEDDSTKAESKKKKNKTKNRDEVKDDGRGDADCRSHGIISNKKKVRSENGRTRSMGYDVPHRQYQSSDNSYCTTQDLGRKGKSCGDDNCSSSRHTGPKSPPVSKYRIPVVGKDFTEQVEREQTCGSCHQTFGTQIDFDFHVPCYDRAGFKLVFGGYKCSKCKEVSLTYGTMGELRFHALKHDRMKFSCSYCQVQKFMQFEMEFHVSSAHPDQLLSPLTPQVSPASSQQKNKPLAKEPVPHQPSIRPEAESPRQKDKQTSVTQIKTQTEARSQSLAPKSQAKYFKLPQDSITSSSKGDNSDTCAPS